MKIPLSLQEKLQELQGDKDQAIADALFQTDIAIDFEIGAVVLTRLNVADNMIDRVALSRTPPAVGAVRASTKQFESIRIPADAKENALARCIAGGKSEIVTDWYELFTPALSAQEARDNQAGAGVMCSVVNSYAGKESSGALIFSLLCGAEEVGSEHLAVFNEFANLVGEIS